MPMPKPVLFQRVSTRSRPTLVHRSRSFPTAAACRPAASPRLGSYVPTGNIWAREVSKGLLGIRNIPLNGLSSSRIRKIALPIASEQHRKPIINVAFRGASNPKLAN